MLASLAWVARPSTIFNDVGWYETNRPRDMPLSVVSAQAASVFGTSRGITGCARSARRQTEPETDPDDVRFEARHRETDPNTSDSASSIASIVVNRTDRPRAR